MDELTILREVMHHFRKEDIPAFIIKGSIISAIDFNWTKYFIKVNKYGTLVVYDVNGYPVRWYEYYDMDLCIEFFKKLYIPIRDSND